jgi:hypothetical protein
MDVPVYSYDQLPLYAAVTIRDATLEEGRITCVDGKVLKIKAARVANVGSPLGYQYRFLLQCETHGEAAK